MEVQDIMKLKIAELSLSTASRRNAIVRWLLNSEESKNWTTEKLAKHLSDFTVVDVINKINSPIRNWRGLAGWLVEFRDTVINFGLTKLDWISLPIRTINEEMLKGLGKKKLKEKSIILLGTLSGLIKQCLEDEFNKPAERIMIGELLGLSLDDWRAVQRHDFQYCVSSTRKKLLEIGFEYQDGIFLQQGTRHEFIEWLMKEESLNYEEASKMADIARKYMWIKKSADWDLIP